MDGQSVHNQTLPNGSGSTSVLDAFKEAGGTVEQADAPGARDAGTKAGGKDAANTKDGTAPGGKEGDAALPSLKAWGDSLSKDLKENTEAVAHLAQFEDVSSLAAAYLALEKQQDALVRIPDAEGSKDELEAFYRKLGKPERAEQYGFDKKHEAEKLFAEAAFKAHLTDSQAKELYGFIHRMGEVQEAKVQTFLAEQAQATDALLQKEYGALIGEKMNQYKRALKTFANEAVFDQLKQTGFAYHPEIVKMFIRIGEAIGEKGIATGDTQAAGAITSVRNGGTFSFFS